MTEEFDMGNPKARGARPQYRMQAVVRMTGLTPHTIRVWERRYGAITPARSLGGDRLYSEEEVGRLRLLRRMKDAGHAIGTVATLPTTELERILTATAEARPEAAESNGNLLLTGSKARFLNAINRLDTQDADRIVARLAGSLELGPLIHEFLVPILEQIGERWAEGTFTVAQEHAASALIRNQMALLLRLYPGPSNGRCVVAGTPRDEWHEFGALLAALVAGSQGWRVLYLGANLPAEEIARAAQNAAAEKVLLSWISAERETTLAEIVRMRRQLTPAVRVLLGGRAAQALAEAPQGITLVSDLRHLERLLALS